ncbi:MAG TPA: polyribonucleotide nucleotidyltransferase [Candidatus Pelethousia gallinarum]|nr:polyribonucleotide nucleotidyltransferase [Candidatus Pelethousia gallinarum]
MQGNFSMELAGRTLSVITGKYAEQAGGSALVRCGDTVVLVCATVAKAPRDGVDFLPLSIEFEEKMYSVGKIPGGFIKREGRPSEKAILTDRLIDRPLRPLFPKGFYNDIQVIATVLSVDQDVQPDILAMLGSSIALSISEAPFMGPTGAVAVGMVDGKYIINPNSEQRAKSRLTLTVAGTRDAVMMVEAGACELTEQEMLDAILYAHEEIKKIVAFIEDIQAQVGKPKMEVNIYQPDPAFAEEVRSYARDKVEWSLDTFDRYEREDRSSQVKEETVAHFAEAYPDSEKDVDSILYTLTKEIVRDKIINRHIRPDGRKQDEIRPIWCETGILPRTHGSAVFTRGQTQVMTIATLGCMGDGQTLDGIGEEDFKRYIHHYNMPPYSVGETRPVRSPGRREIGHGALAERALLPMIPSEEEFPYAIRLVSEVVSSNGSTSQASICASTMALMDAGVPIKKPVAGVAMGLIKDDANGNIAVLTDIQGLEDFLGDMDFKVAGTKDGITAIQMDIKIKGIDKEILIRALEQARQGRLFILNKMLETIPEPRKELSPYAPRILQFTIHPDKIREVIGSGGKTINGIIAETGVKIDIEDDGRVFIASPDMAAAEKAKKIIDSICHDIEVGEVFLGKVVNILPIGAQVELKPGKKGLVHISRLANHRVERVEDEVSVGDELLVRVIAVKPDGKIDLTRKDLLPDAKK